MDFQFVLVEIRAKGYFTSHIIRVQKSRDSKTSTNPYVLALHVMRIWFSRWLRYWYAMRYILH